MTSGERSGGSGIPFLVGGAVAVAYVLLALADGGNDPAVWAQATIVVWWTVLVALLARAWPRSPIPAAAAVAGVCLLAYTVLTGVSMVWASDLGAAFEEAVRAAGYLGVFVLAAIAARAGMGRPLLTGIAIGLLAVALLALLSRLEPGFVTGPDEARGLAVSGGRLSYPLGYWNALGACMAMALPLLVWLGAGAGSAWRRALATAAIPVCALAMFFSGSRGGVLAAAVGLAALALAGPRRLQLAFVAALGLGVSVPLMLFGGASPDLVDGADTAAAHDRGDQLLVLTVVATALVALIARWADRATVRLRPPEVRLRWVAAGIAAIGVVALLLVDPVERLRSLDETPGATEVSARGTPTRFASVGGSGRGQFWDTAADAFAEEPFHGIGAGGFEAYWAQYGQLEFTVTHAHSLFLESAAELGFAGPLLILGLVAASASAGVRRLRAAAVRGDPDAAAGAVGAGLAVLAAATVSAAVEWTWDIPAAFVPLLAAAAFVAVPPAVASGAAERAPRRRRLGGAAIVLAALLSLGAAGALYWTETKLDESRRAIADDEPRVALEEASSATDVLPFAAEPWHQLAVAKARLGRADAAARAIEKAEERATEDWSLWLAEAGIEFRAGNTGRGVWALNRARELNPKAPAEVFGAPTALRAGYFRRLALELGFGS